MTAFTTEGIQALRTERKAKAEELKAMLVSTGNVMTEEQNAKYDGISKEMLAIDDKIAKMEQAITLVGSEAPEAQPTPLGQPVAREPGRPVLLTPQTAPTFRAQPLHPDVETFGGITDGMENAIHFGTEQIIRKSRRAMSKDEARGIAFDQMTVFDKVMRRIPLKDDEYRIWNDMTSTVSDSSGGFAVPDGFGAYIIELRKTQTGVRQNANVSTFAQSRDIPWVTSDQTAMEASPIVELSEPAEADPTIGQKTMKFDRWCTPFVDISERLLRDAEFDMAAWLAGNFARAMGRGQNKGFTIGNTTNNVNVEGYTETVLAALTTDGASGQTTTVKIGDLISVVYKLDESYIDNSKWFMHRGTLSQIIGFRDTDGHPVYVPNYVSGQPATLLGYPVVQNAHQPTQAASALSITFGNMAEAYHIGDVPGSVRFHTIDRDATYILKGIVGFMFEMYSAGITLQPNALSYYKNAAS